MKLKDRFKKAVTNIGNTTNPKESAPTTKKEEYFPPESKKEEPKKEIELEQPTKNPLYNFDFKAWASATLFVNDSISICAEACSCCWDKPCPESMTAKLEYIGRRAKTGHTSILEHSNMIIGVYIDYKFIEHVIELLTYVRYLKVLTKRSHQGGRQGFYIILGGSWRAYEDLFFNMPNQTNPILILIKNQIYSYAPKEVFYKSIENEFLDEESFNTTSPNLVDKSHCTTNFPNMHMDTEDYIDVVNQDNIKDILDAINQFIYEDNREESDYFTLYEIGDFANITICFKNMSRTATHQLVRHRNAITQESQRYVDYSTRPFINPIDYSKNKYKNDPNNRLYKINNQYYTPKEIAFEHLKAYRALISDKTNPLHREDARAFLPANIACGKLYMTFTYTSFAKFIELRTGNGAQDEIKAFAMACLDWFSQFNEDINLSNFLNSRTTTINEKYQNKYEEPIKEEN